MKKKSKNKMKAKIAGRTKSIQKRKKTLLLEYKLKDKSNKFVDRRIGEKNRNMTAEDKLMARFVAHRVKSSKKEIFNLGGDEEEFTHHGRSLRDIEKFDAPIDDSDDEDDGKLDASFVKEAHFGGGLFTKVAPGSSSHQNTIDMLIAESKRKKAERQQTKEETQNLTEKLDQDLKDIYPLIADSNKNEPEEFKPKRDPYDILVRELKFEPVGRPSDKLKSEEQIRKEETQRLRKLEEERLERMKRAVEPTPDGEDEPPNKKHQSADDLDDGLDLELFDNEDDDDNNNEVDDDDDDDDAEDNDVDDDDDDDEVGEEEDDEDDEIEEKKKSNEDAKKNLQIQSGVSKANQLLQNLRETADVEKRISLIEDTIKKQQVHTGVSNVDQLMQFFRMLIHYIDELFSGTVNKDCWILVSKLSPTLFDLVQVSGDAAAQIIFDLVRKKHGTFNSNMKQGATPDMLVILKLVPLLFPTSDYHHAVTTPATVFLARIISQNTCKNSQTITEGLFLTTVMLEYISLSNRYCPEAVNFLRRVLYTAIPDTQEAIPPVNSKTKTLLLKGNFSKKKISTQNLQLSYNSLTSDDEADDDNKLKLIFTCLKLLSAFVKYYDTLPSAYAIWSPILKQLELLPIDTYPKYCCDEVTLLKNNITSLNRPLQYLMAERKRPKVLRLYEPNIREVIDGQSFRTVSQAKLEREKLLHLYKREMKGALKEIRKDNSFIARVKVSEQAQKDAERKSKVRQILNWGQNQQSELKRMERKNRYRH